MIQEFQSKGDGLSITDDYINAVRTVVMSDSMRIDGTAQNGGWDVFQSNFFKIIEEKMVENNVIALRSP